ncbi:MAG: LemA family protein [Patescibacteria group bacterium]|jgi:LemA protein
MNNILIVILVVIVLLILWLINVYNSLIKLKNRVKEAWSDIDVQLKRRYDLIPNLMETVKGYMKHEEGVLVKVTEARTSAMNAKGIEEKGKAENMLSETLKSLFAVAENYPDLKASQNFLQLQDEISDTENKIQASRRFYNGQVRDFNTKIEVFPNNLIAGMLKFKAWDFFAIENDKEKENVQVKF